jgi:hypothetical protein
MRLFIKCSFIPVGHDHVCAFLSEQICKRIADPVCCGVHKCALPFDLIIHAKLSMVLFPADDVWSIDE